VATLHFGSSQPLIPAASASCRKIEKGAFSTRILFNSRKRERKSFSPPYFCPEEITRFTGEPCATELPLAGSWLITLPVATVLLLCWVTVPPMSFTAVMSIVSSQSALSQSLEGSAGLQIDHKSWWSTDSYVQRSAERFRLCRPNS